MSACRSTIFYSRATKTASPFDLVARRGLRPIANRAGSQDNGWDAIQINADRSLEGRARPPPNHQKRPETMKMKLTAMPIVMEGPNTAMRRQSDLGDMDITFSELPKGTDFSPLLKGLSNDSCSCPHWGYIIAGVFKITYDDGTEERLEKGDGFYLPPGHTAYVEEDLKCVMFSPDHANGEVLAHAMSNLAELSK